MLEKKKDTKRKIAPRVIPPGLSIPEVEELLKSKVEEGTTISYIKLKYQMRDVPNLRY